MAVLLDVSPDHLDWHPSFEHYVAAKRRIFENQEARDWAVVYGGNPLTVEMAEKSRSRKLYFDLDCLGERLPHVHLEGPFVVKHEDGTTTALASLEEFQLLGRHNRLNAMAASATAALLGASGEALEEAFDQFQGLPHALEPVADIGGVRFFNDSKATNVTAVRAALESFDGAVLLILGGRFKGGDLRDLRELVSRRVKRVLAIGESRELVREALEGTTPITICSDLEEAVREAHRAAVPGDVVLLSPAGSSFDMFRDYRERGETFRADRAPAGGGRVSDGGEARARQDALHHRHRARLLRSRDALSARRRWSPTRRIGARTFFLVKQAMWAAVGLLLMLALDALRLPEAEASRPRLRTARSHGGTSRLRALHGSAQEFPPMDSLRAPVVPAVGARQAHARRRARLPARPATGAHRGFRLGWLPSLSTTGFLAFLVLIEPDYGTAISLVFIGTCLFFVSGVSFGQLTVLAVASAPLLVWLVFSEDYRRQRFLTFIDPFSDPLGRGFQIIQSLIAVGSGGILGRGFMRSQQKFFYLPEPHSDFVFAVIGEELGLLGALAVLAAFCVLLWRGLVVAHKAPDRFGSLLATGLTMMLVGQALINMGVVLGILPTTGLPLPFISSGGSSLVASMVAVGLLLSVSQHARA